MNSLWQTVCVEKHVQFSDKKEISEPVAEH